MLLVFYSRFLLHGKRTEGKRSMSTTTATTEEAKKNDAIAPKEEKSEVVKKDTSNKPNKSLTKLTSAELEKKIEELFKNSTPATVYESPPFNNTLFIRSFAVVYRGFLALFSLSVLQVYPTSIALISTQVESLLDYVRDQKAREIREALNPQGFKDVSATSADLVLLLASVLAFTRLCVALVEVVERAAVRYDTELVKTPEEQERAAKLEHERNRENVLENIRRGKTGERLVKPQKVEMRVARGEVLTGCFTVILVLLCTGVALMVHMHSPNHMRGFSGIFAILVVLGATISAAVDETLGSLHRFLSVTQDLTLSLMIALSVYSIVKWA